MKTTSIAKALAAIIVCQLFVGASLAKATEVDHHEREQRLQWWRDARFGMFVHWGLYSALAGEWKGRSVNQPKNLEWIQHYVRADSDDYAKMAIPRFRPKNGFAREWARLAKQAGCRYLVFTTKHHDGFALHDSKVSDFDAGSILQRDLVREIVEACHAEGLRIGFYYSVIDWHHDQFAYLDSNEIPHPLRSIPYPDGVRDHQKYIEYMHAQVEELVTNYGKVDIMWWDYSVTDFQGDKAWGASKLIEMVRRYQPHIVMNNRLYRSAAAGMTGTAKSSQHTTIDPQYGDFMTPEQRIPDVGITGADWETCMTMNNTWGFSLHDREWKSTDVLVRSLIEIVSKGGNFLLNVGPTADGSIPVASIERLQEIGRWLEINGEAIYGSSASPVAKPPWGRITTNSERGQIFLHIFDWPQDGNLEVQGLEFEVSKAQLLDGNVEIPVERQGNRLQLTLPSDCPDPIASVIRLECSRD